MLTALSPAPTGYNERLQKRLVCQKIVRTVVRFVARNNYFFLNNLQRSIHEGEVPQRGRLVAGRGQGRLESIRMLGVWSVLVLLCGKRVVVDQVIEQLDLRDEVART